ncbi:MAG TPA: flagellar hook protein FlgE [Terracidiphilus sp.]|jgi:flagellar hook protein FlgE|nr:flagellar hook protein FlgE [Terracidiphilus sp.]
MSSFSLPLSGLAASSDSLNVIANNLANLNTDGYKDETLNFADVFNQVQGVSGNGDPIEFGSGVKVAGQFANFHDGTVASTGIASNMALQGNGFFVVLDQADNQTSFTRNGDFGVNSQGQIVTAEGQIVMGYPAVSGQISTSAPLGPINVNQATNIPAVATTSMQMNTNLDASAGVGTTFSAPITVYDSLGASHVLSITYTNTAANTWSYNISVPSSDITGGTGTSTTVKSGTMTFDSSGNLTSPTGPISGINISNLADGAANMSVTWNLTGSGGAALITQQDAASASNDPIQNGYGVGTLTGYTVLSDGTVQGQFSNDQTIALGRVAVASFANVQGLLQTGSGDYQPTFASGPAVIGQAGAGGNGKITGGAVEQSNVNLSTEFANMIVAQQSYEANAKVLTTMDQVSQATIQLIQ